MIKNEIKSFFCENGYVVINDFLSNNEVEIISDFVEGWINKNIANALNTNKIYLKIKDFPDYHNFIINNKIDHAKIASAIYRYIEPPEKIIKIIHKELLFEYLHSFSGLHQYEKWQDPGFGWLGYRLIRANSNDGYPPSCKNWGAASNVYSMWLPIAGCNESSNIRFLPKSHKREFKKYLPENTKFTKGEYRLDENICDEEFIRPEVSENGIIIYHPACIHSEDSAEMKKTRLNLEYRFKPINES